MPGKPHDGLPSRAPLGRQRDTRPGDVSRALTGRWGPHGARLLDLLGDFAEGRYIPRRLSNGELAPGQKHEDDPARIPSLELQARCIVILIERIVGKVPDVLVTADAGERPKFDLSKVKSRDDLKFLKRILREVTPTAAEVVADTPTGGDSGP